VAVAVLPNHLDAVRGVRIFSGNSFPHSAQLREDPLEPLPTALEFGVIGQDFKQFPVQATMVLPGAFAQGFMHGLLNTSNTQGSHRY